MGRRNLALLILCALALQQELPIAHAPEHPDSAASRLARAQDASPPSLQPARAAHGTAHDPASCPVCQSLHAKPAVPPPAAPERSLPELAQGLPAPALRAHACVALAAHPPRAPPLALSLA